MFLSTLSLRRATICRHEMLRKMRVSIHALLAESDHTNTYNAILMCKVSIHALLAESDAKPFEHYYNHHEFLSTLSLRRATFVRCRFWALSNVSIHALLAESDLRL